MREYCGNRPAKLRFSIIDFFVNSLVFIVGKKKNHSYNPPKQVLLFNFGHLGDILMMGYMVSALKKQYPSVQIHLVVGKWCKVLVEKNPQYEKVYYLDHYKTNRQAISTFAKYKIYIEGVLSLLKSCKNISYTHSFDFRYSGYNANLIVPFLNIQQKYGFGTKGFGGLLDKEYFMLADGTQTIDVQAQGLNDIGVAIDSATIEATLPSCLEEKTALNLSNNYFMLFPEAGTTNRMFTFNFWINIVETLLLQKKNAQIMVCGVTDFSEKLNEALIAKFGTTTITPFSKLSIPQIISTLKSSQGAITLDSFPAHLSASQTPTLCLFKEGTGSEYFPINAFSTYIIHNHQFSKNFYTFRSKMKIVYIDSFENQGFNDILTMAISTVFK